MVEHAAVKTGMKKENRTYANRRKYLISAVKKRRKVLRLKSLEYKGNRCEICGYSRCNDALEFHHIEKDKKDFGISMRGYTRSWVKVRQEIDKCLLVCANCHRELHAKNSSHPE